MQDDVAAVRDFNRFYTRAIGVLGPATCGRRIRSPRRASLYELGQAERTEVAALRRHMSIDGGHLSRVLARLERDGLVAREPSPGDARRRRVRLTGAGAEAFATLDRRAADETAARLDALDAAGRRRLMDALAEVRRLLEPAAGRQPSCCAPPRPGELGWVVQRHGELYAEEYGWDASFEALVARIVAGYANGRDPAREAAWIAAVDGAPAGCVFCMRKDDADGAAAPAARRAAGARPGPRRPARGRVPRLRPRGAATAS